MAPLCVLPWGLDFALLARLWLSLTEYLLPRLDVTMAHCSQLQWCLVARKEGTDLTACYAEQALSSWFISLKHSSHRGILHSFGLGYGSRNNKRFYSRQLYSPRSRHWKRHCTIGSAVQPTRVPEA